MDITFKALEDIPKGSIVKLNIDTGVLEIGEDIIVLDKLPKVQPKEQPNIIENSQQACPIYSEIECRDDIIGICRCCGHIYSRRLERGDHNLDDLLI